MREQQDTPSVFNFISWWKSDPIKAALISGLGFLSWLATYTGMVELIAANTGNISIEIQVAIGFAVGMLMLMILYLLESLFSPDTPGWLKPMFVVGYVFLTLISVGFGFGFYWKYLESRSEATRSAESAITQVQRSLQVGQTRMEQLLTTFSSLAVISADKAKVERERGGTCGRSRPGDGPRRRLRDNDAQQFDFARNFIKERVGIVKKDLVALNDDIKKVLNGDPSTVDPATGTRNRFLSELGRKLGLTTSRFNAVKTDPQLIQIRDSLHERSQKVTFPTGRGKRTFRCPDTQLQTALRGAVRAIDEMHVIKDVQIAAVEGAEAIVEAFRRLAVTVIALPTLQLPPSPDEIRAKRKQVISTGGKSNETLSESSAGLGQRDYIPLFVAIFVDLCILLVSLNRRVNRLAKIRVQMEDASHGRFHDVLTRIEQYQDRKEIDGTGSHGIDLLNEVIVSNHGEYFAAVPINSQDSDSRFLTNLFLGLEGIGIVKRQSTMMNAISTLLGMGVEKKLMRQGSKLVDTLQKKHPDKKIEFRIYRFYKNILASVMLDAIHGTANKVSAIQRNKAFTDQEKYKNDRNKLNMLSSRMVAIHMDLDKRHRAAVKEKRDQADKIPVETPPVPQAAPGSSPASAVAALEINQTPAQVSLPELRSMIANTNEEEVDDKEATNDSFQTANLSRVTAGLKRKERIHALGNVINGFSHKSLAAVAVTSEPQPVDTVTAPIQIPEPVAAPSPVQPEISVQDSVHTKNSPMKTNGNSAGSTNDGPLIEDVLNKLNSEKIDKQVPNQAVNETPNNVLSVANEGPIGGPGSVDDTFQPPASLEDRIENIAPTAVEAAVKADEPTANFESIKPTTGLTQPRPAQNKMDDANLLDDIGEDIKGRWIAERFAPNKKDE